MNQGDTVTPIPDLQQVRADTMDKGNQSSKKSDRASGVRPKLKQPSNHTRQQVPVAPAQAFRRVSDQSPSEANPGDLLTLQQAMGNRFVQGMLDSPSELGSPGVVQRWKWPWEKSKPKTEAERKREEREKQQKALKKFKNKGPYPKTAKGKLLQPSTKMGGFNARYDPSSQKLSIVVNLAMTFLNGLKIQGNRVTANDTSFNKAATQINKLARKLRGKKRTEFLAQVKKDWQWTGAGDPRISSWMNEYKTTVQNAWGSGGTGFKFQSTNPGWEKQYAYVDMVVNTTNVTAKPDGTVPAVPKEKKPVHCQGKIYKTPDDNTDYGAAVAAGRANVPTDQTLYLGSGQLRSKSKSGSYQIPFASGKTELSNNLKAGLRKFIISYQAPAGGTGTRIDITGRSSTVGDKTEEGRKKNLKLSQDRAKTVADFLKTEVVEGSTLRNAAIRIKTATGVGSTGATKDKSWQRVDLVIGGGLQQNVALHEFGHMIGLGDEYASTPKKDAHGNIVRDAEGNQVTRGLISGTGGDVGDKSEHHALSNKMGTGNSVFENNENLMSMGNTIKKQHYATFMEALHTVTKSNKWKVAS